MDLQKVHSILNNKEKSDVFYDERPVWIQGVDEKQLKFSVKIPAFFQGYIMPL